MILGGSTNAVLHLIAIAHSVGIKLTIADFQAVSDRTPFIADLKPSGKYVMVREPLLSPYIHLIMGPTNPFYTGGCVQDWWYPKYVFLAIDYG